MIPIIYPEECPVGLIRPAKIEDYNFIMDSWKKSFHTVEPINFIPNEDYFPWQTMRITQCLNSAKVLVATLEDEPDAIIGYICANPIQSDLLLHWIFVRSTFRRLEVAKTLLNQFQYHKIICTHYSHLFKKLKNSYHLSYNPTILEHII